MTFPLFRRPGTVVFLDDDPDYLDMLSLVLPRHWRVLLFLRPQDCINYLQQEPPVWETDAWNQQQLVDQWRDGAPLIPQVLAYWSANPDRYALAQVCVVDYSMPAMDGLQALGELVDWPGSRVLLTGQADEQVAVRAFNEGLIDQFIAKQTADISRRLIDAVEHLLATPNPRHAQIWRSTLTPEQMAVLRVPSVSRDLTEFAAKRWVEHVTIGDPFGVLGVDAAGRVSWLQLEQASSLGELVQLAEAEGIPASQLADIRQGRKLVDLELRQALGRKGPPELNPAFLIGREQSLLGALFNVDPEFVPDVSASYNSWLGRQERRSVRT
jgi:CheY-like chemotaxis protein